MLYEGLGYSHLRSLTKANVDLINRCIYIDDVTLPLHNKLVPLLTDYLEKRANKHFHMFYYRGPISSSGLYRMLTKYNNDTVRFTPTYIRKAFFNKLYRLKIPLDVIYCLYSLKPEYYNLLDYNELINVINKIDW